LGFDTIGERLASIRVGVNQGWGLGWRRLAGLRGLRWPVYRRWSPFGDRRSGLTGERITQVGRLDVGFGVAQPTVQNPGRLEERIEPQHEIATEKSLLATSSVLERQDSQRRLVG